MDEELPAVGRGRHKSHRRCYGAAVEAAIVGAVVSEDADWKPRAPRLHELLSQLDADGHDTRQFRAELSQLLSAFALIQFAVHCNDPAVAEKLAAGRGGTLHSPR